MDKFKELEENVLKFWKEHDIFRKDQERKLPPVSKTSKKNPSLLDRALNAKKIYSFYDGPPFASGRPHYGHILATAIKDTVTRYWSMRGYFVDRRVGWDCHGLPVENLVEKREKIKNKREIIEHIGIERFNEMCRATVFESVSEFERVLTRVGRWADYAEAYTTLDNTYMESVWWVFKSLYDNDLIYEDFRVAPYCPRCATPLSNFEVSEGYKEVEDTSVYVKFRVKGDPSDNVRGTQEHTTYFLVWTTTPWTLPANVALAIHPELTYVYAQVKNETTGREEIYILAHDRLSVLGGHVQVLKEVSGKKLLGLTYDPPYHFSFEKTSGENHSHNKEPYRVVRGDFVSREDGTGIVHIAPAFGENDMNVMRENGLPMILNVDENGVFAKLHTSYKEQEVYKALEGNLVKAGNAVIIEDLAQRHILVKQEPVRHNYPFCWRCEHYLIYYAIKSWYVAVTKFKKELVKNNQNITWVPEHLKEGRFGEWLEGARDWGISRNRFWGAPLPVWRCEDCGNLEVMGGKEDMKKHMAPARNAYYFLRHGEATHNVEGFYASWPEKRESSLTPKGTKQIEKTLPKLKKAGIDIILASDLRRTKETAEIVAQDLCIPIVYDERLREYDQGVLNGRPLIDKKEELEKGFPGGETLLMVRARMLSCIKELETRYQGKKILVVSHGDPLWLLDAAVQGKDMEETLTHQYPEVAIFKELPVKLWPFDKQGNLNFHRPYIDEVHFVCKQCKGTMTRISEVFDCWFESGSMPYAQYHYPFEHKEWVERVFPADFIAEGLDQTRGWFYTLHVLGTALTRNNTRSHGASRNGGVGLRKGSGAFKNVIVNGLVLAEDGKKLSKRLNNYPEPQVMIDTYGADSIRYFLLASTPIGEDYRFSERGVADISSKIVDTLLNTYNFLTFYRTRAVKPVKLSSVAHVLDQWIVIRLSELIHGIHREMERYELTRAARLFAGFIEDCSNWYLRRSRRRFQQPASEKEFDEVSGVLVEILKTMAILVAPFLPFTAEHMYQQLKTYHPGLLESVHFEAYPEKPILKSGNAEGKLVRHMALVREIVSIGKKLRAEKKIRVRQPIASVSFTMKGLEDGMDERLHSLIAEELNAKEAKVDNTLTENVWIDDQITPELREEGMVREIIRVVQEMRKDGGLRPQDAVTLSIQAPDDIAIILRKHLVSLKQEIKAKHVEEGKGTKHAWIVDREFDLDQRKIWLGISKE